MTDNIELQSVESQGEVFSIGDHVRVMTEAEVASKYGRDDSGRILFSSGPYNYRRIGSAIGGMDFVITAIRDNGRFARFLYSDTEPYADRLREWIIDAEICVKLDDEELDPTQLSVLLGGD